MFPGVRINPQGRIFAAPASGPITGATVNAGFRFELTDALAVDEVGAITHHTGGVPQTATGAIAGSLSAPTHFHSGLGFSADGRLCGDEVNPVDHWYAGLPFVASGALAVGGVAGLYVNHLLSGGSSSGPGPGAFPPIAHTLPFFTLNGTPIDSGGGDFAWDINPTEALGRFVLSYNLTLNNPTLAAGQIYRFLVDVENKSSFQLGRGVALVNVLNATLMYEDFIVPALTTKTLTMIIRIDGAGFTSQIRFGVGPTANASNHIVVRDPSLWPVTLAEIQAFTNGFDGGFGP